MTIIRANLYGHDDRLPPLGPTLADVLARISKPKELPLQRRRNLQSAIRTLCRALNRPPELVPVDPATLRGLLIHAAPAEAGLSASRWRNVTSGVRTAIRVSGLVPEPAPDSVPLDDGWELVAGRVQPAAPRSVLRRFARFCCALQLAPEQVDDETVDRYLACLKGRQLSKDPKRSAKDLIRAWNRYVASDPSGRFPRLDPRNESRSYTSPWSGLPHALAADAAAFRTASLKPRLFAAGPFGSEAPRRPVKPSTAAQRDRMLRRLAAAEILAGVEASELCSLADLVHPERLRRGLEFFLERAGGRPNRQVWEMAYLALTIARHWADLPDNRLVELKAWCKDLRLPQQGLTDKNRARLRQFSSRESFQPLLALPRQLAAKAERLPVHSRSALMLQTAIAIGLLSAAPMRIGNLVSLDRQEHFRHAFSLEERQWHLVIPRDQVKNRVPLEFPVPAWLMDMIDRYLARYQPLLTGKRRSTLLFPGRREGPKGTSALRKTIVDTVRRETALHINPHLFRHLAALIFLTEHPGEYESVRQLLGHRTIQTTVNSYTGFETMAAVRRYSRMIEDLSDDPGGQRVPGPHARAQRSGRRR